jgi:hypothetical protein
MQPLKFETTTHACVGMAHTSLILKIFMHLNYTKDLYEFTTTPIHLMFQNKFYKLTMQDDTNMLDFLFIVKDRLVQIVGIGNVIKDEDVVLTIRNVLP